MIKLRQPSQSDCSVPLAWERSCRGDLILFRSALPQKDSSRQGGQKATALIFMTPVLTFRAYTDALWNNLFWSFWSIHIAMVLIGQSPWYQSITHGLAVLWLLYQEPLASLILLFVWKEKSFNIIYITSISTAQSSSPQPQLPPIFYSLYRGFSIFISATFS